MNVQKRQALYQQIISYLTSPVGVTLSGRPVYPTLLQAALKYNFSVNHIFRIKKTLLGLDKDIQGRQDARHGI